MVPCRKLGIVTSASAGAAAASTSAGAAAASTSAGAAAASTSAGAAAASTSAGAAAASTSASAAAASASAAAASASAAAASAGAAAASAGAAAASAGAAAASADRRGNHLNSICHLRRKRQSPEFHLSPQTEEAITLLYLTRPSFISQPNNTTNASRAKWSTCFRVDLQFCDFDRPLPGGAVPGYTTASDVHTLHAAPTDLYSKLVQRPPKL
ncbi:hypothetical protein FHG87_019985, partial [Trinorchestia longiramus]